MKVITLDQYEIGDWESCQSLEIAMQKRGIRGTRISSLEEFIKVASRHFKYTDEFLNQFKLDRTILKSELDDYSFSSLIDLLKEHCQIEFSNNQKIFIVGDYDDYNVDFSFEYDDCFYLCSWSTSA